MTKLVMNNHEKTLLANFVEFLNINSSIELDFRTHVYLENHVGLTPTYSYDIAEAIVNGLFQYLDNHHTDRSRYNKSMMIDSLRMGQLNLFLVGCLTSIDEDVFYAMKRDEAPTFSIERVGISLDADNPCLCVDVDENTQAFICNRLGIEQQSGCGCDGFINVQYPIDTESQIYVAGSNLIDDIEAYSSDDIITDLIDTIIHQSKKQVSRRDFELDQLFQTTNIKTHDNGVLHSFYNGLSLALLENIDTDEAYVTFECMTTEQAAFFPCGYKTFENIKQAREYIAHHCKGRGLQDFSISQAIHNELESI